MTDEPATPIPEALGTAAPARTLGGIAQLAAVAVGVVYTLGILIVNLNLGQYGILSLDLARPEYVMAGLLWVFLTSIAVWGVHSIVIIVKSHGSQRPRPWIRIVLRSFFFGCVPTLGVLTGLGYEPGTDAPAWVRSAGGLLVLATGGVLYRAAGIAMALRKDPIKLLASATPHLDQLIFHIPLLLVGLGLYAGAVYPDLPREYGGGRRTTVEVVLSEETSIDWKAAGLGYSAQRKTVGPAMVLLDTPGSLVIVRAETWRERRFFRIATSAQVVTLDRKLVSAVVYLPKGQGIQVPKK